MRLVLNGTRLEILAECQLGAPGTSKYMLSLDMYINILSHLLYFFLFSYIGLGPHNYCRNPNGAEQPWCYVNKDTCDTDYCDVSGIGEETWISLYFSLRCIDHLFSDTCYDAVENCDELISKQKLYCVSKAEAFSKCHKTCNFCNKEITDPGEGNFLSSFILPVEYITDFCLL